MRFHATYFVTCCDELQLRSLLCPLEDHAQQSLSIQLCRARTMQNTGLCLVRSRWLVFSFSRFRPVMDDIEIPTLLDNIEICVKGLLFVIVLQGHDAHVRMA